MPVCKTAKPNSNNLLRIKTRPKQRDGFTMIELMVVLIIIAILVAIAVPIYDSVKQTARDRTDEANVRILNSATLQWMLADDANNPKVEDTTSLKGELEGNFIMEWPQSPNEKVYKLVNGFWEVGAP